MSDKDGRLVGYDGGKGKKSFIVHFRGDADGRGAEDFIVREEVAFVLSYIITQKLIEAFGFVDRREQEEHLSRPIVEGQGSQHRQSFRGRDEDVLVVVYLFVVLVSKEIGEQGDFVQYGHQRL